jgi:putative endonuclease
MPSEAFFTYILSCADGTFYTGWTTDIPKRLKTHNAGKGARYTRSRLPVEVVASWSFSNQAEAMQFEYQIKQLSRHQKQALIAQSQQS